MSGPTQPKGMLAVAVLFAGTGLILAEQAWVASPRVHVPAGIAYALAATLFLGGYVPLFPFLRFVPGPVWFLLKTGLIIFLLIWIRWTFPRLREDQLQKFAWKVLIPLSLVNIFVTGALKLAHWT